VIAHGWKRKLPIFDHRAIKLQVNLPSRQLSNPTGVPEIMYLGQTLLSASFDTSAAADQRLVFSRQVSDVAFWHLADVHADRYFDRYRGKNGHAASTREPTRLTHRDIAGGSFTVVHNGARLLPAAGARPDHSISGHRAVKL
jgi:hypothetical protein